MKVDTFLFGNIEVDPNNVIEFPAGLVNFENNRRFMLVHETDAGDPVSYTLQSLDDPLFALQIIEPAALGFTYELSLTDKESSAIKLSNPQDAVIALILYKRQGESTANLGANLRAPLIINPQSRLGLQKLLTKIRPNVVLSNLSSEA